MRSKVSTVGFKEVTSKLRAVICDDAVGDPETAHETFDKLDRGARWDGADGFHLHLRALEGMNPGYPAPRPQTAMRVG